MGPYAGVDYNPTLCPLLAESTPTNLPWPPWELGNPMQESTLTLFQSRLYQPVMYFGFGFSTSGSSCHAGDWLNNTL
jgi:hypothetical protein